MFVKAILVTLVLASSTLGLASPQIHKRDIHNRHAHLAARNPIPVLRSADVVNPLRRRHQRTKRCERKPQTPDAAAPIKVEAVNSTPAQPQQPPQADPPAQSNPSPPAQPAQPDPPADPSPPSGGRAMSGDGTFYEPGLGACGMVNVVTDLIVAVAHNIFDNYPGATANPNNNPICGKVVTAHYQGKSVPVTIVDRCGGCSGDGDLDFTITAFTQLADEAVGRIHGITWTLPL